MMNTPSAAVDLGLGDGYALSEQLKTDEEERKKKLLAMDRAKPGDYGDGVMGLAAMHLGLGGVSG